MFIIVIRPNYKLTYTQGKRKKKMRKKIKTIIYKRIETDDGNAIYIVFMIKYYEEKQI